MKWENISLTPNLMSIIKINISFTFINLGNLNQFKEK